MELKPASYVVLGMLSVGARSGYEIRRYVELSARFFWTISPVQIYPELKRLEHAGLVVGQDDGRGGTRRRLFQLTDAGREELRAWLRHGGTPSVEWRDMGLLKLFFADVLEPRDAIQLVHALRERSAQLTDLFHEQIIPAALAAQQARSTHYPALVARFGLDFNQWVVRWCADAERQIARGSLDPDA